MDFFRFGEPTGQFTRARHHHEKPEHPDWQGTFNLNNLFEKPELYAIDSHCPQSEVDYYCYSTSPNEGYKTENWRSYQQGKAYH